ncbi:ACT domain-containing protein ACR6 [Vitis vinifera]|uniref:ACT domain-containing protein ACR n=1 Tax=Vitis vinifera TaxID=29760 RepID=A0A438EPH8_VITVI|nr:ACT domain-containing protein ACR6 [Vitis vinifera]
MPSENHPSIELSGTDMPSLLSEVCVVLTDLHCNVVNAEIWTHNARVAVVVHVTDDSTGHVDGLPMSLDAERERVIQCLEAAIERRASEGLELELCTEDQFGLLSDITRVKNSTLSPNAPQETTMSFLFGNIFKCRTLQNFKLIRSYS